MQLVKPTVIPCMMPCFTPISLGTSRACAHTTVSLMRSKKLQILIPQAQFTREDEHAKLFARERAAASKLWQWTRRWHNKRKCSSCDVCAPLHRL